MPIQFECSCGHEFRTRSANAGKSIICPNCNKKQKVPQPDDGEELAEAAPPKPAGKPSAKASRSASSRKPDEERLQALPPVVKKRKKNDPSEPVETAESLKKTKAPLGLILGIIGGAVVLLGGIAGLALMAANSQKAPQAPLQVQYVGVQHDTSSHLKWQIPDTWKSKIGGGTGGIPASLSCEDGTARIALKMSPGGSAIGDTTRALDQGQQADDPELQPAAKTHAFLELGAKEAWPGYKEVGPAQVIKIPLGDARVSQFTAEGSWGKQIAGYRCTVLSVDTYSIYCTCPAGQWKRYEPIFRKVLESIGG